ncbi:MAG: YjbF family lipoprotein [Pseudodonghicola sp.]
MSARVIRGRAGLVAALAVALLGLAGCSGGTDATPVQLQILEAARGGAGRMAARLRDGQASAPALSRAQLEATGLTLTEVTVERRDDMTAYLLRTLVRHDSDPGLIEVWSTEDGNVSLTTRNGLVIATRGLGGDLLSSQVEVAENRPGPAGGGAQVQMIRDLDYRESPLALSCDLADLGSETIEILGQRQATRHLQQRCEGGGGRVVNDYWTDAGSGIVWQSRQWAGPYVGYLRLRRVTK